MNGDDPPTAMDMILQRAAQRALEEEEKGVIELAPHEGELEFWDKIMRDPRQPIQRRMKAAELSAQYRYPRQAAVATASISGKDFATLLERAIKRSGMTPEELREGKPMKLIEA